MALDVVIPTYNRPASVARLVDEVLRCVPAPPRVVVVDSSDEVQVDLGSTPGVTVVASSHKNQPYQRYVGLMVATAPFVVMLDDDLEVLDRGILGALGSALAEPGVVGATCGLQLEKYRGDPSFLGSRHRLAGGMLGLFRRLRAPLPAGAMDSFGRCGPAPAADCDVQWMSGGVMAFRRDVALGLFDETLFALFETRQAMGEDKALSMRARGQGELRYIARAMLRHPATEGSHYQAEPAAFLTKVLISRYYLARLHATASRGNSQALWVRFAALLGRAFVNGVMSGQAVAAFSAIRRTLVFLAGTRLEASRICPGVDFWADARRDATRTLLGAVPVPAAGAR